MALLILLALFFVFNVATSNIYPQVWCDEVWFSDPPVNMVTEGVLHTRTYKFQPPHTFPAINCPLYFMAQVPWLAVMGTSVLAIRSFNYLLMAVAALLVWVVAWRFELVKSAGARLLLVALLHLGYGMSFAYRCSRPDILGMVCLLFLVLAFGIPGRRVREWSILGLSAVTFWIGFQVAFFAGFACVAAVLFLRPVWVRELMLVSLGLALGGCSLIAFLDWHGALANFLPAVVGTLGKRYGHASISFTSKLFQVIRGVPSSYVDDFSTTFLLLGLAAVLLTSWRRLTSRTRAVNLFCLILVFGAPLLFDLLGHWVFYYSYLRFVPASVALFATVSELAQRGTTIGASNSRSGVEAGVGRFAWLVKPVWLAAVVLAMAVGLPMRLALSLGCSHLVPRNEIQQVIRSKINPDDVVLSDTAPFYEVKQAAKLVYSISYSSALFPMHVQGGHDFTPEEKRSFSVLVLRSEKSSDVTNHIGGRWQAVTEPFGETQDFSRLARLPLIGRRLASYAVQPQTVRYQFQIFRRVPDGIGGRAP
jgi:hypothetical protein